MLRKIIFSLSVCLLWIRPFLATAADPKTDILYSLAFILVAIGLLNKETVSSSIKKPVFYFILLFLTSIVISILTSTNFQISLSEFYKYALYALVFFAVVGLRKQEKNILLIALFAGSFAVSFDALHWLLKGLFGLIDYLNAHPQEKEFALEYVSRGRAFVPFCIPSALGGYLILFAPLGIALLSENASKGSLCLKRSAKNVSILTAVLLIFLALLATQSLGALLALGASAFIYFLKQQGNTRNRFFFIGLLIFACVLALLFFLRNTTPGGLNLPLLSLTERISYWKQALVVIKQHPWMGVGLGNYPFYKSLAAHNSYLQIWAETGILGFLAFIGIAYQTLKTPALFSKTDGHYRIKGLWIGSTAFLIHNLVDFTFFQPEVCLLWWVVAALLVS